MWVVSDVVSERCRWAVLRGAAGVNTVVEQRFYMKLESYIRAATHMPSTELDQAAGTLKSVSKHWSGYPRGFVRISEMNSF